MIYVVLETVDDFTSKILFLSTSKKNSLAKFSECKALSDSEYETFGVCNLKYELREYPNDYDAADCVEYNVIDKTT